MTAFTIRVEGGTRAFACDGAQPVLAAMRLADLHDIAFKCRAGGCGTCRVQVLEGAYALGTVSPGQVEPEELAAHVVLACELYPRSDLVVRAYRRSIEGVMGERRSTAVRVGPMMSDRAR